MICIYAGSFHPFTYGHASVVDEAYNLLSGDNDKLIVMPVYNSSKGIWAETYVAMAAAIEKYYTEEHPLPKVEVVRNYGELTAAMAKKLNAEYLVRGIRDTSDFLYEEQLAKMNQIINPGIKTLYIRAKNNISGSLVREMLAHDADIRYLVPNSIYETIMAMRDKYVQ